MRNFLCDSRRIFIIPNIQIAHVMKKNFVSLAIRLIFFMFWFLFYCRSISSWVILHLFFFSFRNFFIVSTSILLHKICFMDFFLILNFPVSNGIQSFRSSEYCWIWIFVFFLYIFYCTANWRLFQNVINQFLLLCIWLVKINIPQNDLCVHVDIIQTTLFQMFTLLFWMKCEILFTIWLAFELHDYGKMKLHKQNKTTKIRKKENLLYFDTWKKKMANHINDCFGLFAIANANCELNNIGDCFVANVVSSLYYLSCISNDCCLPQWFCGFYKSDAVSVAAQCSCGRREK